MPTGNSFTSHRPNAKSVRLIEGIKKVTDDAMKRGGKQAGLSARTTTAPCPKGGGTCAIWQYDGAGGEGGVTLYHDQNRKLVAMKTEGNGGQETMIIEYGVFPVNVPAGQPIG